MLKCRSLEWKYLAEEFNLDSSGKLKIKNLALDLVSFIWKTQSSS